MRWDDWVKTCGQPTVWCGFDWPEIVESYVVLPQSTCPDCDGGPATGYCHIDAAEVERLRALLKAIERHTAPSTRTWDTCLRDMGLANDLARAALEPKP